MEFKSCGKCKDGYIYKSDPTGFFQTVTECDCHKKWAAENLLEKQYKHNGFDMRHFTYSPRSYAGTKSVADKDRLINYVNQFELNPEVRKLMVYMYGPNGTQKSTLASWVGKSLLSKGFSVRYVLMNDLIHTLMDAEDFKEERKEKAVAKIEKLESTDLIIVDESFDKEKMKLYKSGFMLSFLDSWIRRRIGQLNKGILFVSNVKIEDIEANGLSHSIQDFVEREVKLHNCYLQFLDNYLQSTVREFSGSLF